MSLPAQKKEGVYRNPIKEVVRFFDTKHPGEFLLPMHVLSRDMAGCKSKTLFEKVKIRVCLGMKLAVLDARTGSQNRENRRALWERYGIM